MNIALFIKKILKPLTQKPSFREVAVFFLFLLAPNILRQILYWRAKISTGSIAFIDSPETQLIFQAHFPYLGILEEIVIAIVFSFFWFKYARLRFFAYGWISDAFIDYLFVILWFMFGATPLQVFGLSSFTRFFMREGVISYIIFGPLLAFLKPNIKKVSAIYTLLGIMTIVFVVVL